jgi:hypothetical protein
MVVAMGRQLHIYFHDAVMYRWKITYSEIDTPGKEYTIIVKASNDENEARRAWSRSSSAGSRFVRAERLERV